MLLAAILFVPYLRKAGSYTLPSFLGHRFRSRGLRMAASVMQLPPTALLAGRRDQDRRADRRAVPAGLLLHRRAGAGGADRGDRHSRRHAVADLDGKRGVPGRRRRIDRGRNHRLDHAHQLPAPQLTYGEMFSSLHNAEITAGLTPLRAGRARDRFAGHDAGADGQALPATLRQSRSDGFRHAVSQPRARHGGAAEPADAKRRDQLDRRSAPLDRLGTPVRGPVRHDGPGHRRLRQADRLPRHRAGLGLLAAGLAHRTRRQAPASGRRRQRRRRDRRGRAAHRAATASRSRCHGRRGCLTCRAC